MYSWKRAALAIFFACTLILPAGVRADSQTASQRWAKGTAQAVNTLNVFAPMGGQLMDFDLNPGDTVEARALLLSLRPLQVTAPKSGTIRLLKAAAGDQAATVAAQYGALCWIDRTDVMIVSATVAAAYSKPKNRAIILGETLRAYNGDESDSKETVGTVVAVSGKAYTVEIPANVFDLEDTVRLYRGEGDTYNAKDKVGEGKAARSPLIPVTGEGAIAKVLVQEGQTVAQGDPLFYLDSASAIHTAPASTTVAADEGGVISALYVQPGQQVMKDQLMMKIQPLDAMEFIINVDETDLSTLALGKALEVKVDAMPGQSFTATVKTISPLGVLDLDTTKYPVTLSLQTPLQGLLPGMHVTAYWD